MLLNRVTAPAETPISRTELKTHLRIEHDTDDTYLDGVIAAAVAEIDGRFGYLRRSIVTQTWDMWLPWFPVDRRICLPMGPLQSVTHVKYYDRDDVEQTFSSASYETVTAGLDGYVYLKPGQSWPATYERELAVNIRFVSGYGAASAIPANIKHAVLLRCGEIYQNRGDVSSDMPGLSDGVRRLLEPSRVVSI